MTESQEEKDDVSLFGLMFMKLEICFYFSLWCCPRSRQEYGEGICGGAWHVSPEV